MYGQGGQAGQDLSGANRSYNETNDLSAKRERLTPLPPAQECAASRQPAKVAIRDRAWQLRLEAGRLERLALALPEEMSPEADQALWELVMSSRR